LWQRSRAVTEAQTVGCSVIAAVAVVNVAAVDVVSQHFDSGSVGGTLDDMVGESRY